MRAVAVIVAAGEGERLGGRKQFLPLGGVPLVLWSCRAFLAHPSVEDVVVVLPADAPDAPPEWLPSRHVDWCRGGASRRVSAGNGVAAVPAWAEIVLIHDAARPFVSQSTIGAVLEAAEAVGAALPTLPVSDTVKRVREGRVLETVDRSDLAGAQTPQAFRTDLIREVHDWAQREGASASDDASLCEIRGHAVACVPGDPRNLKITTAADFTLAQWLVDSGSVGIEGVDGDSRGPV